MSFIKKYGIAILVTGLLIALSILIGGRGIKQAANRDYYERWVIDDAQLLSDDSKRSFGALNESLDKQYGSVTGVITVRSLHGEDIAKSVYEMGHTSGFGQNDLVLLISAEDRQWYLGYGDQIAQYADQSLRLLFIDCLDDGLYDGKTDIELGTLFDRLPDWYAKHVPRGGTSANRRTGISGLGFLGTLLRSALLIYILVALFRFLLYPLFSYSRLRRWSPLGGWVIFPLLALLFRSKSGGGAQAGGFGSNRRGGF